MVKKNKISNPFLDIFKLFFVGTFGVISAYAVVGLYSAIFTGIGYYILDRYNKQNTKLLDDLQTEQYIGLVFCFLGLLPWIQYFFMSFMVEGGSYAFDSIMSE
jgi:hypothetical protein